MNNSDIQYQLTFKKILASTVYIVNNLKKIREVDFIYLFKILYLAEKFHLSKYGRPIIDNRYIAMPQGPVQSLTYDLIKAIRGDGEKYEQYSEFYSSFRVYKKYHIDTLEGIEPDMDYLSKSDIECIDESINKYGGWDSESLSDESHDEAWASAFESYNTDMKLEEIAKAGGAKPELIQYITHSHNLQNADVRYAK